MMIKTPFYFRETAFYFSDTPLYFRRMVSVLILGAKAMTIVSAFCYLCKKFCHDFKSERICRGLQCHKSLW